MMTPEIFLRSEDFIGLGAKQQKLFSYLLKQLNDLDIVVKRRGDPTPVYVLKVREIYQSNPNVQSNIATIRIRSNYIRIGPYKDGDENANNYLRIGDIDDLLIDKIKRNYEEILGRFRGSK